jgi:hypothetical protein
VTEKYLVTRVIYDRDECIANFTQAIRRAVEILIRASADVTSQAEGGHSLHGPMILL